MDSLIDDIVECFPSPEYAIPQKAVDVLKDEEVFVNLNQDKPFSALVLKLLQIHL
ncbi:hypothetical protein B0H68_005110 [Clostridium beijerinckii]|nr:hypothetical protein [Clostridium beijerinckii]